MRRMAGAVTVLVMAGMALGAGRPAVAQLGESTDPQSEVNMGRQVAREVEQEIPVSHDQAMVQRVARIGSALVAAMPVRAYPYTFHVLASPEVNAFSLPGGFIFVYAGLLNKMPDDNELAFVMGHELTHAAHRHWVKAMHRGAMPEVLVIMAALAGGPLLGNLADITNQLVSLGYSREQEEDADRGGIELEWRAGFDPIGAVHAMEVLEKMGHHSLPTWLEDHPSSADRLKRLKALRTALLNKPRPILAPAPSATTVTLDQFLGKVPDVDLAANPWFPLGVGDKWTYSIGSGGATSGPDYTIRIAGQAVVEKGSIYRGEITVGSAKPVTCQFVTTASQVWRRSQPADPDSHWDLAYAMVPPGGPVLNAAGQLFQSQPGASLETPCGIFTDVLKIRLNDGDSHFDLWFARGVGLLKRLNVDTHVTETLISYTVNK